MIKPGWTGTWTGWHGLHQSHLDLHDGGVDPGPASFFCSATSLFHCDVGDPFPISWCFTVPLPLPENERVVEIEKVKRKWFLFEMNLNLLGCGARRVMAEEEENKRKMKVGNNQKQWWWWWCLGWRSAHILMRWNAHVSVNSEEKMKRLMRVRKREWKVWYY